MTKPVITVNRLWKKYDLSLNASGSYRLLRDEITKYFRWPKAVSLAESKVFWALKDVSFKVNPGDALGIIGPNGAGKSTLLKILSRITYPTKGYISITGRVASLLEIGTGFSPELTGRENIYLNGAILGMSKKEINSKLDEIIDFAEIKQFIDIPVKHYSNGMHIRLAFSIAAFLEPEILLVDEVLAVGDLRFQKKSLGKMDEVTRKKGRTVIYVSHDLASIKRLCQKAILIDHGQVVFQGEASATINYYLQKVNQSIPTSGEIITTKSRIGTGEIQIKKIEITDSEDHIIQTTRSGEDIKIRIFYDLVKKGEYANVLAGILAKSELNTPIFLQHNYLTGDDFGVISKPGYFELEIRDLPLAPGTYNFNCSLMPNNGIGGKYYDSLEDAFCLTVGYGDYFSTGNLPQITHGYTLVKGKWSLK
jgi:lipopolysaccharide transport system ATP-binding protein